MWITESTIFCMFYFKKNYYISNYIFQDKICICSTKNRWAKGSSREKCISYGRIPDVVFNRDDSLETLRHILPCDVFSVTCFRDDVSIAISRYIFPPSRCTSVCERWPWGPLTVAHRSVVTLYSFLFTLLC